MITRQTYELTVLVELTHEETEYLANQVGTLVVHVPGSADPQQGGHIAGRLTRLHFAGDPLSVRRRRQHREV